MQRIPILWPMRSSSAVTALADSRSRSNSETRAPYVKAKNSALHLGWRCQRVLAVLVLFLDDMADVICATGIRNGNGFAPEVF